ncbi:ATP-binding protein [Sinomonas terrae]|uniref:ATP-binding protein n=1 Tax=Sinomonas terrae TaxID=2908838 RepID=A0ABS9U3B5_9MICC|nr:ATP-binding protein [Sinomonas terrae]MCH6471187.1 ATP-binding protein [Sinomonas terrae]
MTTSAWWTIRSIMAAIVDRVTFNAHILETGTDSYRLRTSRTSSRRKSTAAAASS